MAEDRKGKGGRAPRVDASHALRLVDITSPSVTQNKEDGDAAIPQSKDHPHHPSLTSPDVPRKASERKGSVAVSLDRIPLASPCGGEITDITPDEEGTVMVITVLTRELAEDSVESGEDSENSSGGRGRTLRHRIRLLAEQYMALRPAVGVVDAAFLERLISAGRLCDAIRKGMELLGYGNMSCRRMSDKLVVRGFDREVAREATVYLSDHGYLSEENTALRFAEQGVRKQWGPRRIREDLFARGFSSETISVTMESLDEVDFSEICARVMTKKYGGVPQDPAARRKMIAALMRLGFSMEHIKGATEYL